MALTKFPIEFITAPATTPQAVIKSLDGKAWNTSGTPALEAYSTAHYANYAIQLTQLGSGRSWYLAVPSTLPAGAYSVTASVPLVTATPVEATDVIVGIGPLNWDGTNLLDVGTTPPVNVTQFGGSAAPVTNLGTVFNTDYATNYDATNHFWNHNGSQLLPTNPVANSYGEAMFLADISGGRKATAQAGSLNTITLDSGASTDSTSFVGDVIYLYSGTGGGIRGTGQRRTVVAYNGTTKVAIVDRNWTTIPDNTTTFITLPQGLTNLGLVGGVGVLAKLLVGADGSVATLGPDYAPFMFRNSLTTSGPSPTYFVRSTGNDSNGGITSDDAFLTIAHAITVINTTSPFPTFSCIDIAGVNDLGSAIIILPIGCYLKGDGKLSAGGTTNIRSSSTGSSGTIVQLQSGSRVSDLTITSTSSSGNFGEPLGYRNNSSLTIGVFRVWNVDTISDSDGAYFSDGNGCNGYGIFENCNFTSKWDSSQIVQENSTLILDFFDCNFIANGPSTISSVTRQTGVVASGGITRLWNCTCSSTAGGSGKPSYGVLARGNAFVQITGGTMSGGTGTGGDYDLATQDRGTIIAHGVTLAHNSFSGQVHFFEAPTKISTGTGTNQLNLVNGNVALQSGQIVITGTNNDKTGYSLVDGAITAPKIGTGALNGKGDWLLSSGYTAPDNMGIANTLTQATLATSASSTAATAATSAASSSSSAATASAAVKLVTDKLSTMLQAATGTGYEYTGTALINTPTGTGSSSGGATIDPSQVDEENIWRFESEDQLTATNQIRQIVGFKGLLAMEMDEVLPENDTLHDASIAIVSPSSGIVIGNSIGLGLAPGLRKILINVTSTTVAGTYVVVVYGTTIDSQIFPRRGILVLESLTGT